MQLEECFVYKLGAREGSSGHRAETWGLASPFRTCRLRVVCTSALCVIQLLDKLPTGDVRLFAAARMSVADALSLGLNHYLEPVRHAGRRASHSPPRALSPRAHAHRRLHDIST